MPPTRSRRWPMPNPQALRRIDAHLCETEAARWQPIATAPRDGTDILLVDSRAGAGGMVVASWSEEIHEEASRSGHCWWGQEASGAFGYHTDAFTHWMPLPAPPDLPPGYSDGEYADPAKPVSEQAEAGDVVPGPDVAPVADGEMVEF